MGRRYLSFCRMFAALVFLLNMAGGSSAGEALHRRIDRVLEAKLDGEPAALATDAEFLRRVSLDLGGRIPTSAEARAFLDDSSPYKRERLIDRLLASPQYAWRMQEVFDVLLMERRDDAHVPSAQWRTFLRSAFAENRPYNQLVALILTADGTDPRTRGAAKFTLDRQAEPNLLTRDIGRMFLGRDLQCAQCHDHPLIDDYKQAHYYGLFAFLNRTSVFTGEPIGPVLAEKAEGDVTFTSVFKKKLMHKTGPRLLDGPAVDEPVLTNGVEYLLAPAKDNKVRPIPRFSRRAELAPRLTSGLVPEFNRNIVNRLWALLMGRGLVHPLDMHHSENPPSQPELLDLLAREFVAGGFDIKAFLRELALTQAYQRSSEPPPGSSPSDASATVPALAVAALKPLTPEQLAWSLMQGLGLAESERRQAEKGLDGHDPRMRAIFQADAKRQRLRALMIEEAVHERLKGGVAPFVRQFGAAAGQPQDAAEPTVHQALFLSNGQPVQSWLTPTGSNLIGRLAAMPDPGAATEELYLSLYSRRPTEEERTEVAGYLADRGKDRAAAWQELAWAILASTEFRFNH
jgi:hypothetical protein